MTERPAILPQTTFAEMAAILLLTVSQSVINEHTEAFVARIKDDDSRRAFVLEIERLRRDNAVMADLYRTIIALEPHEAAVRALVTQLYRKNDSGNSAAAQKENLAGLISP